MGCSYRLISGYRAASLCFTCKVLRGKVLPCWVWVGLLLWCVWEAVFLSPFAAVEAGGWKGFCATGCPRDCSTPSHHSYHLRFPQTVWFPRWLMWNCTWTVSPALLADGNRVVNKDPVLAPEELIGLKRSHSSHRPYATVHRAGQKHLFLRYHFISPIAAQHSSEGFAWALCRGRRAWEVGSPRRDPSRVNSSPFSTPSETHSSAAQVCTDPVHYPVLTQVPMADTALDWGVSRLRSCPWSPFAA